MELSNVWSSEVFLAYAAGVCAVLVASGVLLVYGGHHAIKGRTRKAALESLSAGLLLLGLYLFVYVYTALTQNFGAFTPLLFIPAIVAAAIAFVTPETRPEETVAKPTKPEMRRDLTAPV